MAKEGSPKRADKRSAVPKYFWWRLLKAGHLIKIWWTDKILSMQMEQIGTGSACNKCLCIRYICPIRSLESFTLKFLFREWEAR